MSRATRANPVITAGDANILFGRREQMIQSYGGIAWSRSAATGSYTMRNTHRISVAARSIRFVFNFAQYVAPNNQPAETLVNGGTEIAVKASYEYNNSVYPIVFNGRRSTAYAAGLLISDPVALDVAAGTLLPVRVYIATANGQNFPVSLPVQGPNGTYTGDGYTSGSDVTDVTTAVVSPQALASYATVAAIVGVPNDPTPVLGVVGDSIPSGQKAASGTSTDYADSFVTRAVAGAIPLFRLTSPGVRLNSIRTLHQSLFPQLAYCTDVLVSIGTNDLFDGRTAAQLIADLTWLYDTLLDLGCRVHGATLLPHTTSTDSYATLANQTVYSSAFAAGAGSDRGQVNAWIRSGAGGRQSTYIETADAVESARDSGKWAVNGSANYLTSDGLHPNSAAHTLMASTIHLSAFALPA